MVRWAVLLIAFTACKQEKPPGRKLTLPPAEPPPVRVELGECARSGDEFVSGDARPDPTYWKELDQPAWGTIGTGRYGTIGHGTSFGQGWPHGSIRGRSSSVPLTMLSTFEITGIDATKWKPLVRRYVKRNIADISYCYEKQLLENDALAGKFVATLDIDKAGKVKATVTESFDDKVSTCIKGVLDKIAMPKPENAFSAVVPITFAPSHEAQEARRVEEMNATAVGTSHPLAGREAEIAACLRTTPAAPGTGVIDWQFGVDGKPSTTTLVGAENECMKKIATTATNTSRAKNVRCAFATGDAPAPALTFEILPDGKLRFEGSTHEMYQLQSKISAAVKYHSSTWASAVTRGPIALAPGPTVTMKVVKSVLEQTNDMNFATVFVVPHAFGGTRLLGAHLPLLMHPKGRTHDAPLHVVHVHRIGADVDDVPVASSAELMTALHRMRADGTAVQIRFDLDTTFGDFAQVVDMATEAGLSDWQL